MPNALSDMAGLVDTNILVYAYDKRDPEKRSRARDFLERGIEERSLVLSHQTVLEFVSVVSRPHRPQGQHLMPLEEAVTQAEALFDTFPVLYPTEGVFRLALRGMATYRLPWFDAHMWAYAEFYGLSPLYTEDFESGIRIGTVEIVNPLE